MKYVKFKGGSFAVFSDHIIHADIASACEKPVESAGFVMLTNDGPEAHGESVSLGLTSKPEDTEQLRDFLI